MCPSVGRSVGPSVRNAFSQTPSRHILGRVFGLVDPPTAPLAVIFTVAEVLRILDQCRAIFILRTSGLLLVEVLRFQTTNHLISPLAEYIL